MTGISEIAEGDEGIPFYLEVPDMPVEELHPDDQDLIWWWELLEPALPPHLIDPKARYLAELKRKKR